MITTAKVNHKDHIRDPWLFEHFLCNYPCPSVYQHVNHSVATVTRKNFSMC